MRIARLSLPALAVLALASCNNAGAPAGTAAMQQEKDMQIAADSISPATSYADGRMLIKTAEYKCLVGDVYRATDAIERLTQSLGGMVTDSKMEQEAMREQEVPVSCDSVRRMKTFIPVAHLTLKVPVGQSDSVLHAIQALSVVPEVPLRHVYYDDVTLDVRANAMKNDAYGRNDHSDAALTHARKSEEILAVDQYKNNGSEQHIDRTLSNLALTDEVNYATIHVDFEQPEQILFTTVANTAYLARATFLQRLRTTLAGSINLLQEMILLLLQIWPLMALAAAVIFVLRLLRRKPSNILTGR